MGKIVLLDDLTINQIAAGEVIERPASVVKELVENSIDANAKNIVVEIKNGGISYIRITDDGNGIEKDDMEIAFERHATSKIRSADDLDDVKTMGFRGEALASVASIANVQMISKTRNEEFGNQLTIKGGDILSENEIGAKDGTSITITELFYNTPVRYKFLKKDFTESGYIEDTITRIALANPGVAIKLINTGKVVIQTSGTGRLEDVIYSIYGKEIYDNILPVDYQFEGYHITGVIGKPIISRSNRTNQLFFVNKRFVKDKTLTSAAEQGFKGLVTVGKHGFLILNIDMDPKKVDVNVHPTKLEVRFQEDGIVFKAVYHAIKETLLKSDLVSDPVKDYTSATPNEILKDISKKSSLEAWSIKPNYENGQNKNNNETANENDSETKNENWNKFGNENWKQTANEKNTQYENNAPKFSDFKNTISDLDFNTRKSFIDEVTKAKTPEEILKNLRNYTKLVIKQNTTNDNQEVNQEVKQEDNQDFRQNDKQKDNQYIGQEAKQDDSQNVKQDYIQGINQENSQNASIEEIANKSDTTNLENTKSSEEVSSNIENKKATENAEISYSSNLANTETAEIAGSENIENKGTTENADNNSINDEINKTEENNEEYDLKEPSFEEMYKKLFGRDIATAQKEYEEKNKNSEFTLMEPISKNEESLFEANEEIPPYQFVGIAFKTYIILTMKDELYILDQHAAHERIMYEKVKKNYFSTSQKDSQLMLLPDVITLNNRDMGIYRDNKEMFEKAGFIIEEFGEDTVKIVGVPSFCLNFNNREIFLETLDGINTVARTAKQEVEDKFLATIACKAAVKAHMALSKEEVDSLMSQLLKLPNPFSCPHGRPTVIKMTKNDIEKKFSRRM